MNATATHARQYSRPQPAQPPAFFRRLAAAGGIIFALLLVPSMMLIPRRPPDILPDRAPAWYVAHQGELAFGALLEGIAVSFLLIFVVQLYQQLDGATGSGRELPLVAFSGGVLVVGMRFVTEAVAVASAYTAAHQPDFGAFRAFEDLAHLLNHLYAFPLVLLLSAASLAMLRTRVAPRPIAWLGLAAALVQLIGLGVIYETATATGISEGPFHQIQTLGLLLFAVWVLAASVALVRYTGVERHSAAISVAPA